jgi:hypothetical protein
MLNKMLFAKYYIKHLKINISLKNIKNKINEPK